MIKRKNRIYMDEYAYAEKILSENKRMCTCGHTYVPFYNSKKEYRICSWCGSRLYFDEKKQKKYDNEKKKKEFIFTIKKGLL